MRFFEYLDFFAPSDSRFSNSCISVKYCHIITTIHQWKAYLKKLTLMTGFVVPGHILNILMVLISYLPNIIEGNTFC